MLMMFGLIVMFISTDGHHREYTPEVAEVIIPEMVLSDTIEIEPRYGFEESEVYLLAQLLCGDKSKDGDGEYDFDYENPNKLNHEEIGKVLCVVMNRVRDARFPDTVEEVVLAKRQFSVMPKNRNAIPSDLALAVVREWCYAYDKYDLSKQCIPEDHIYFTGNGVINITRN